MVRALCPAGTRRLSSAPATTVPRPNRHAAQATPLPHLSSQATLSASRWLVGSSSSRMSGADSSRRHSATRRRSPGAGGEGVAGQAADGGRSGVSNAAPRYALRRTGPYCCRQQEWPLCVRESPQGTVKRRGAALVLDWLPSCGLSLHPALPLIPLRTAAEVLDQGVRRRAAQCVHGLLHGALHLPAVGGVQLGLRAGRGRGRGRRGPTGTGGPEARAGRIGYGSAASSFASLSMPNCFKHGCRMPTITIRAPRRCPCSPVAFGHACP